MLGTERTALHQRPTWQHRLPAQPACSRPEVHPPQDTGPNHGGATTSSPHNTAAIPTLPFSNLQPGPVRPDRVSSTWPISGHSEGLSLEADLDLSRGVAVHRPLEFWGRGLFSDGRQSVPSVRRRQGRPPWPRARPLQPAWGEVGLGGSCPEPGVGEWPGLRRSLSSLLGGQWSGGEFCAGGSGGGGHRVSSLWVWRSCKAVRLTALTRVSGPAA